jgi:hypothetical protein
MLQNLTMTGMTTITDEECHYTFAEPNNILSWHWCHRVYNSHELFATHTEKKMENFEKVMLEVWDCRVHPDLMICACSPSYLGGRDQRTDIWGKKLVRPHLNK